ncbi:MAG: hypothetical protein GWO38_04035 [Phycisphaerae bacterium]|nr:hypothetical protein [Phycisphaerae bacterium]NIX26810.1 hypothetical protein [Phycisphaerae bacterium]
MLARLKLTAAELITSPKARTVCILGTLVVAALVGGAPSDVGGGTGP